MLIFADGRERISQDAECDRESVRGAFDGNKHTPDIYEDGSSRLSCVQCYMRLPRTAQHF